MSDSLEEAERLEGLWAGSFGSDYAQRNRAAARGRRPFWEALLGKYEVESALEVGCNVGGNLVWLHELLDPVTVAGIDVNEDAVKAAAEAAPGVKVRVGSAFDIPFEDASFDLAFTTGVLIHVPPAQLPDAMREIARCSRRYVLCGEYYAPQLEEVPYRGERGALFKQDFGAAYIEHCPELTEVDSGFLSAESGPWDDVTWWLFEKA